MEFQDVVRKRRMVRNFSDEPISEEQIERIIATAQRGPSAGFSQGVSFVAVTDPATRQDLARFAGEEFYTSELGMDPFMSKAPLQIVICTSEKVYRDRYDEPDKRGEGEEAPVWPVPYWHIDAGAAMMLVLLKIVDEGLASTFVGFQDLPGVKERLQIPEEFTPIGMVVTGHGAPDTRSNSLKRGRRKLEDVLHRDRW